MKNNRFQTIADKIQGRDDIVSFLEGEGEIKGLFDLPNDLPSERTELYKKLYVGVGNTPVYQVKLPNNNRLHIKSEYFNALGNSHYSRLWVPYLFIAELLGVITPGMSHLIEVTSGNSGIALAMACKALNFQLTLVVPSKLPNGRIEPMLSYGANVEKVNGYIDKCISKLRKLVVISGYYPCNHSEELSDIQVKVMKRIAVEYYREFGLPDYSVIGLGNGTSTLALFDYFNLMQGNIRNIIFYPDPLKSDIVLGLYSPVASLRHIEPAMALADQTVYTCPNALSDVMSYYPFDTEITNLGHSSLYAISIAMEVAKQASCKTFFTLAYDKIDRYL